MGQNKANLTLLNIFRGGKMNLYERFKVLEARYDALNMDFEILNRQLREVVFEAGIEQRKASREHKRFMAHARLKLFEKGRR
jgi:hypothetical protein